MNSLQKALSCLTLATTAIVSSASAAVLTDYPVTIEAESGSEFYLCTQQSWGVSHFDVGSYIKFDNVDITDFEEFKVKAVTGADYNSIIEIRVDSPDGPIIAVSRVAQSPTWWPPTVLEHAGVFFAGSQQGVRDLYLTCVGQGAGNIDMIEFRVRPKVSAEISSVVALDTTYDDTYSIYYDAEGIWETQKVTLGISQTMPIETAPSSFVSTYPNKVSPNKDFWCWVATGGISILEPESLSTQILLMGNGTVKPVYATSATAKVTTVETIGGKIVPGHRFAIQGSYYPISAVAYEGYAFSHWELTYIDNNQSELVILDANAPSTVIKRTCTYWTCSASAELRAIFYQQ